MNDKNKHYQDLFNKKKYSELIFLLESSKSYKNLLAGELNLLGITKLKIKKDKKNILEVLEYFESGFLKEKTTEASINCLQNYLNLTADLFSISEEEIDMQKAISYYERTIENIIPNYNLLNAAKRIYWRLSEIEKVILTLSQMATRKIDMSANCSYFFSKNYVYDWKQKDFLEYSQHIQSILPDLKLNKLEIKKNEKIKLGFLSSDLKSKHSVTYFLKSVLLNYDKSKFEIYLYLNHDESKSDDTTEILKKLVEKSYFINNLDDIRVIQLIRNKGIDIIFDLMGATSDSRPVLFKNKIAPIQISWIGYCNTMGLTEGNYLIADANLIKKNEEILYSEKIIYMPNIWNCHTGFDFEKKYSQRPSLKNNFITFGSFNNFSKINQTVIEVWSKILKDVKNSKLILKPSGKSDFTRLKNLFNKNGVLDSVVFYKKTKSTENHLNLYDQIDIALDTFPYNGVTTTFEALWMGVPVLTMKGFNFNSRCGESINKNLKLDHLISENYSDYINKAIELSTNTEKLDSIRNYINSNVRHSPLFNGSDFSIKFFDILEKIYMEHNK